MEKPQFEQSVQGFPLWTKILIIGVVCVIVGMLLSSFMGANQRSSLREEVSTLQERISTLEATLQLKEEAINKRNLIISDLRDDLRELDVESTDNAEAKSQIASLRDRIASRDNEIVSLTKERDQLMAELQKVRKQMSSASEPQTRAPPSEETQKHTITVYTTRMGTKYHRSSCSYLSKSKIPISLDDAKAQGLTPCSRCKPPF